MRIILKWVERYHRWQNRRLVTYYPSAAVTTRRPCSFRGCNYQRVGTLLVCANCTDTVDPEADQ